MRAGDYNPNAERQARVMLGESVMERKRSLLDYMRSIQDTAPNGGLIRQLCDEIERLTRECEDLHEHVLADEVAALNEELAQVREALAAFPSESPAVMARLAADEIERLRAQILGTKDSPKHGQNRNGPPTAGMDPGGITAPGYSLPSNPQDNLDEWSKDQLVRYARALAQTCYTVQSGMTKDSVTSNLVVALRRDQLNTMRNKAERLEAADEIERLTRELSALRSVPPDATQCTCNLANEPAAKKHASYCPLAAEALENAHSQNGSAQ